MANIQLYMDKALETLKRYDIIPKDGAEESQLVRLLNDVVDVDEGKVLAVAKTVRYMSAFNEVVRDNVAGMNVSDRYNDITEIFDSIRNDSKKIIKQLDDGKLDLGEKASNFLMKLTKGSPHERFQKVKKLYNEVTSDSKKQLDRESAIIEAYGDFRLSLKNAEILAKEVMNSQNATLQAAKAGLNEKVQALDAYTGDDAAEKAKLELARDEARMKFEREDKRYQLIKDVAEDLSNGYNVGESIVAKLNQTHQLKEQVYRRSVTFFTTNEHVFTAMDALYTSQHGLQESTQTLEALKDGANKGLEDLAELDGAVSKAAHKAAYGATLKPESVQKFVDAVVKYQAEQRQSIEVLRKEATEASDRISDIVNDGKKRFAEVINSYQS